jgi:hypothetical protein
VRETRGKSPFQWGLVLWGFRTVRIAELAVALACKFWPFDQWRSDPFFEQGQKSDLYETALTLESLNDRRAVPPLIEALRKDANPHRKHAAESLAYVGTRETIDSLVSVLTDPDVRIRFWSVFGLGGCCRGDVRAVQALESVLVDHETPPGNWWPVGKEALAMLACLPWKENPYRNQLRAEAHLIRSNPHASAEEVRWADFWDFPPPKPKPKR